MMRWSRVDQSAALACRHVRTVLLVGALLVCWPALARDDSRISDADANASAEASGRTIYTHYRAIEAVRAAMDADQTMREDDRVAGEITLGYGGQIHVTLLDDASAALYRAAVSTDGVLAAPIEALPAPAELSQNERAAVQARTTALAFDSRGTGSDSLTRSVVTQPCFPGLRYGEPQPVTTMPPVTPSVGRHQTMPDTRLAPDPGANTACPVS